jgi:hypothetical protein
MKFFDHSHIPQLQHQKSAVVSLSWEAVVGIAIFQLYYGTFNQTEV